MALVPTLSSPLPLSFGSSLYLLFYAQRLYCHRIKISSPYESYSAEPDHFSFACLSYLDVWLETAEADYCEPMSFTTFVDWVVGKVKILGTATTPSVRDLVQVVVPCSSLGLYQDSAFLGKFITKLNGRIFPIVVAAMARLDEQRRQRLLRGMLEAAVEDPTVMWCPLSGYPGNDAEVSGRMSDYDVIRAVSIPQGKLKAGTANHMKQIFRWQVWCRRACWAHHALQNKVRFNMKSCCGGQ